MKTFLEWHPAILHDLHESVPFLYTSTGTGPYNAWLDPIVIDEWQLLAYHEVEEMTKRGVPGVWTHGFYDGWAPNYMFYVANGHNAVGRFYETFGNGGADTMDRTVTTQARREWYRPNPPHPRVRWSLRNNVNLQQSALLLAMHFVSNNKERFLQNFYLKGKRAVAKAANEGPAAYVLPADDPRPVEAADAVNLLRLMGVEVHAAKGDFTAGQQKFPAGSYVVRMDQPYSRMADMMLDTQFYNAADPRPYDDTGWTLGAMRNIRTARVTDRSVLQVPMTLLTSDASVRGRVAGSGGVYVINHNTDNTLATLRFRLKDVKMSAAEEPFKVGDRQFNAGSFVIRGEGNPADLRQRLEAAVAELGLTAHALERAPAVKTHEMPVPRIAIVHSWINTQNEGWYRIEFDRYKIPYTYISDHVLRDTPNLRGRFDVIIYPPVGGSAQQVVGGLPMRGDPIPWKQSELTPNFGTSPDQTDDMRGGMGLKGLSNLQRFVEEGGLFVAVTANVRIPIDYGMVSGVAVRDTPQLQARGSIYNATFADRRSPIAYGYGETLPIYFNQTPVLQVAAGDGVPTGGGGAQAGPTTRPSGRGTLTDPDVIQAMPQAAPTPRRTPPRPGEEPPLTDEQRQQQRSPFYTPPAQRPRVVLRFAPDEKNLLVSGMLAGGSELANAPAVVDVPVGRGHILLFATNPMWRHQTQGAFFLLFNAALNYDSLGVGRAPEATPARVQPTPGEEEQH
jgi:hypothetical protein